jgi:hypothetical protein
VRGRCERVDGGGRVGVGLQAVCGVELLVLGRQHAQRQAVDDGGQVLHEQHAQLPLDLLLQVVAHKGNRVERRRHLERLQRIVAEDQRQTLLLGEDQDDKA